MALNVLVSVLDGSEAKDDDDGQEHDTRGDGGKLWEELEDGYEEEEAGEGETWEERGPGETYMLAMRRNCSRRLRGRKVMMVYFEEMTWLVGRTCVLMGLRLWSKKWSGRGWLT